MREFACYTKVFNYGTGEPEKQRNGMQAMFQSQRESLFLEEERRLKNRVSGENKTCELNFTHVYLEYACSLVDGTVAKIIVFS